MKVLRDPLGRDAPPRGAVLSIGNFDGVHVGHQAVLRHVVERARATGAVAAAMTLDPHPIKLLRPRQAPRLLTTLEQRLQLIGGTGIDVTLVIPFTHRLARMEAEDFVTRVLMERLAVREVYIGANFRFGADRRGDVELLTRMGRELGFVAAAAPTVEVDGAVVSSTRARAAVAQGRLSEAARLLGRLVYVDGTVLEGRRVGRSLGFPTINLECENELYPAKGVYVGAVHVPSFGRTFQAVTNIGVRPTVSESHVVTVESHLLDFAADIYRERVRLYFGARIRDEERFADADHLVAQIKRDVETARRWFDDNPLADLDLVPPSWT